MIFTKRFRDRGWRIENVSHDTVGWYALRGILGAGDGRFQIVWAHCIVRNVARFDVCLYSSTTYLAHESRRGSARIVHGIVKGSVRMIVM